MLCARVVFRCFNRLEKVADRITGTAGPVFVTLAVCLLSFGAICFFETIQPTLQYPWISTPICVLITFNLFAHYYFACTVSPGFVDDPPQEVGTGFFWATKRPVSANKGVALRCTGVRWTEELTITKAVIKKCKRCGQMRPERSHHCRICNRCVLKYDHHCPVRINQCIGLHNERHFVLFGVYLCISAVCFALLGWSRLRDATGLSYQTPWEFYTPEALFIGLYMLCVVMGLALFIMFGWHLWGIASGETSVESQDHEHYRMLASERGAAFVNSYDLGKVINLQLFFNIGEDRFPLYTLLCPFRVPPYTDGRSWARRPGHETHKGVGTGDELTDSDDEEMVTTSS